MKKLLIGSMLATFTLTGVSAATTARIVPSGNGTYSEWNVSPSSSQRYTVVDESSCNSNVDYVSTTVPGAKDSYAVSLNSIPIGSKITNIYIEPCLAKDGTGSTSTATLFYRLNGTKDTYGSSFIVKDSPTFTQSFKQFPLLNVVKTNETSLEIGIRNDTGSGIRLSRIATIIGYSLPLPQPPTNLVSTVYATTTGGKVVLTWNDNATNEMYYIVEKSSNGGASYTSLAVLPANVTAYTISILPGGTYSFRVRAYNSTGYSSYSNVSLVKVIPIATVPNAPMNLSSTYASGTAIIYWTSSGLSDKGYVIERGIDGNSYQVLATTTVDYPYYLETETVPGLYYYRVRAYNDVGYSLYSNVATYYVAPLPLLAPSNVSISVISSTSTLFVPSISWADNASNETGFTIERKLGVSGEYIVIGTVPSGVTTFNDTTAHEVFLNSPLQPATFEYKVSAFNAFGKKESTSVLFSPIYELEVKNAPTNTNVILAATSSASYVLPIISWTDMSNNEQEFVIERKVGNTPSFSVVGTVPADTSLFSDATADAVYRADPLNAAWMTYRVTARNLFGSKTGQEVTISTNRE